MAKKSSDYWKRRFIDLEAASNSYGVDAYRLIEREFEKAQRNIEGAIEAWYGRFAKNNEITMQEARKLLTSSELKEFKWDVKEYIKYGRENDLNQLWMKELENASAKFHISRLEALKVRTQQAAEVAFGNELDVVDSMVRKVFTEDYYHSVYELQKGFNIGWEIGQIDEKKLSKLISKPWAADGKNFSDRIWEQRTQLVNELHSQLTRTCILGKAPDNAIKAIAKKFGVSKNQAGRLVMTEQAYAHAVAQKEAFEELDVEEFEIVATLDSSTSAICEEMDGKHFPMKEYEPGVTAPPFHPWCRSVTVPYFDDEFSVGERAARDENGETYYVPSNVTYKDWKKSMVDGKTEGLEEYMSSTNTSMDLRTAKPTKHSPEELRSLEEYANQKGVKVFQIQKFDGDSEVLKEQIDVIGKLKDEFRYSGDLTITFAELGGGDLGSTLPGSRTITFDVYALRDRKLTNAYLNSDDILSSTDVKGIAAHEMGHKLYEKFGNKGLDIAQKAYYNVFGEKISKIDTLEYLRNNVSTYSVHRKPGTLDKPLKTKYFKEIIPEMLGKDMTIPDKFSNEFVRLLKEVWGI